MGIQVKRSWNAWRGFDAFWSHIKRSVSGTHKVVSKKHLQEYLNGTTISAKGANNGAVILKQTTSNAGLLIQNFVLKYHQCKTKSNPFLFRAVFRSLTFTRTGRTLVGRIVKKCLFTPRAFILFHLSIIPLSKHRNNGDSDKQRFFSLLESVIRPV